MSHRDAFIRAIEDDPASESARLVFADWCEENGEVELARGLRKRRWDREEESLLPIQLRPIIDIAIAELIDDCDWAETFGERSSGNTNDETDPCPPGSDVDTTPPKLADVAEVLASIKDKGDYAETSCLGVFRLKDGRFLIAEGDCDTTGWD